MKKHEREVTQAELDAEKKVLRDLERQYQAALKDIDDKVAQLLGRSDADMQNVIYQVEHQKALRSQIHGILEQLQANEFQTISDFLSASYQQSFVGTMYSMHSQGIPLILPVDKNAMVKAVTTNSRLSEDLYTALGVDIKKLNNAVRSEISRGISAGLSYNEIARNIANASKAPRSRAATIVRTESHRIREESRNDARDMAKKKGADVVKQWDATLDGDTRKSHRKLDGQIREVDEPFEVDGKKAMYPGDFGRPEEDINCRCISLTRARWELDGEELETLKKRAEFFGIDKSQDFEDFAAKYIELSENERYNKLDKVRYSGAVTPEVEQTLEESLAKIPQQHRALAERKITGIEVTNSEVGSSYNRKTGVVSISSLGNPDDVIHEYAHAMAEELGSYKDPAFRAIMLKGLENVKITDLVIDDENFVELIYRVENPKFISKYQGRLYEDASGENGIFDGKNISLDGMLDYLPEGYEEYIRNPTNLKEHDPDLFDYFEGIT